MNQLPNINDINDFSDGQIRCDSLIRKSIEDGYMSVDEYTIAQFVARYVETYAPKVDDFEKQEKIDNKFAFEASAYASIIFQVSTNYCFRNYQKEPTIRSRHMNLEFALF